MSRVLFACLLPLTAAILSAPASAEHTRCPDSAAARDRDVDPHPFTVFLRDGGWCWFQDPRAILHQEHVLLGGVQGSGSGAAVIGVYDLRTRTRRPAFVAHEEFDHDDHNVPVFYPRRDGSVLAVYARHGRETTHYARISAARDFTQWGAERTIHYPDFGRDRVTYMNLHDLRGEGLLYNFFRGIEYNPTFVTSSDEGLTWSPPQHFIRSTLPGRHRPYARYADNGKDTIHVSYTDAHPHRYGNSIYYAAFRNGDFVRADGSRISSLRQDGPLRTTAGERVFQGSGQWAPEAAQRDVRPSAHRAAWTSSLTCDENGNPHIAYSVHLRHNDIRYRIASWDGQQWIDREVAHAGGCLYDRESSYSGLITFDPRDPSFVVISTDVDPQSGRATGGQHEIFAATVRLSDDVDSIAWKPITQSSPVRNIRPVILRDDHRRIILWNRGTYRSYEDYQLDTVGLIQRLD